MAATALGTRDLLGLGLQGADLSARLVCHAWRKAIDPPQPSGDRGVLVTGQWPP